MRGQLTRCVLLLPLLLLPWPAGAAPAPAPVPSPSASASPSPVDRLLDHHAEQGSSWQAWLLLDSEDDASADLAHGQRQGGSAPRRITPKSVFIAPAFTPDQLPACAEGYRADSMGRCVKVLRVDQAAHLDFLLRRLNAKYAPAKQNPVAAAAVQGPPPLPPPQGPLKLPLPVDTHTTSSTASPAPKPTSETPPPKADQSESDDTGAADMIISLFGGQEGSGGGGGGEDTAAVDPTVLSAGPPAEDVDVRDTLPMLVLTHTDSSSPVEDEIVPEPEQFTGEVVTVASPVQRESNSLPPTSSPSPAPQVTLISDKHQHNAGGQMMRDASPVAASDTSPGEDWTPVSSTHESKSPGSSKKRTGEFVSDDWRERPIPSDETAKTVPVGTRNADTSAVGSVQFSNVKVDTTRTGPLETSPVDNPSKKNSAQYPAQMQRQQGSHSSTFATANVPNAHVGSTAYNSYNSPEVHHAQEWSGVTNRIPHTDNGYVRFPQGHGGGYVRFPLDAFQEQRNSGGSKLWWLQPGPNGWRVRHPDARYRPALVRFFTRLPPLHGQTSWDTYARRA
ncbi:flocculation protein FLO11-like [Schistocerca piceifrons]|uniref:flocculation protein FLO11-like n=1 Tax=Schistocerca piceifrons TaxID=274613 RepID=UPI001F5FB152|nr:flocculation protein FLO11-like [Schistocerca piceifrons]